MGKRSESSNSLASLTTCVTEDLDEGQVVDVQDVDVLPRGRSVGNKDLWGPGVWSESCHGETLIFLDWDDTLFPTWELFERRGLEEAASDLEGLADLDEELVPWRQALVRLLDTVCSLARCVVLTSSRDRWVERCVKRFVPEAGLLLRKLTVVYAHEALSRSLIPAYLRGICCLEGLAMWITMVDDDDFQEARCDLRTEAKRVGMEEQCQRFFKDKPWKHLVSVGDAEYEREALKSLAMRSSSIIPKSITLPAMPTLDDLVEGLDMLRTLLPAYVRYNGPLDLEQSDISAHLQQLKSRDGQTVVKQAECSAG